MEVALLDNDTKTMRDALDDACSEAELVRVAVAFARGSGLDAAPALEAAAARGSEVRLLAGVDFQLTDLGALDRLRRPPSSTRVFLSPGGGDETTFHPKVYVAQKGRLATAIVGSSNLTRRASLVRSAARAAQWSSGQALCRVSRADCHTPSDDSESLVAR